MKGGMGGGEGRRDGGTGFAVIAEFDPFVVFGVFLLMYCSQVAVSHCHESIVLRGVSSQAADIMKVLACDVGEFLGRRDCN